MICAVLVIVPGDGVAWSQCKNPRQDIAAFQHRLDVFDFVRIGCGHNDVLPITFKQIISVPAHRRLRYRMAMSSLGQKQTLAVVRLMSALPQKRTSAKASLACPLHGTMPIQDMVRRPLPRLGVSDLPQDPKVLSR